MKRIVKYFLLIILIILTIMSAGCYPTGPRTVETLDDIWGEAAKIDNFTLSLTLPENTPSELPEVTADMMQWERNELLELLAKGKTIVFEKEFIEGEGKQKRPYIEFDDGTELTFTQSLLWFDMLSGYPMDFSDVQSHILRYSDDDFLFVNEIEGFPKSDAVNRARELIEKLGITNLGEPRVLGLTHQDAEKYYNNKYQDDEDFELKEWTEDDDVYLITFPILFNGIPTESHEVHTKMSIPDSRIDVIVTREYVISIDTSKAVSPEYTNGRTIKINYSASDILKKIVSDNSKKQLKYAVDYYDCELTYACVEWLPLKFRFIPVWRFSYTEAVDFGDGVPKMLREHEIYDVESGNRIL